MSYVTPKTDWDATDHFNVDPDWTRIYGNARLASGLAEIMLDEAILFNAVAAPTTTTNPTTILTIVNTLLANIERMRLAMAALLPSLTEIRDDWIANVLPVPSYVHANQWETTIDAVWDYWDGDSLEVCPTLSADLNIGTGEVAIYVDCIDPGEYEIVITDDGVLHVI